MTTIPEPNRPKLTPMLALVLAMHYMADADTRYTEEEYGIVFALWVGMNRRSLTNVSEDDLKFQAGQYRAVTPFATFAAEANALLTHEQKLCLLANVADVALTDGVLAIEERTMFRALMLSFGIDSEEFRPYLRGIMLKHNLGIFH